MTVNDDTTSDDDGTAPGQEAPRYCGVQNPNYEGRHCRKRVDYGNNHMEPGAHRDEQGDEWGWA